MKGKIKRFLCFIFPTTLYILAILMIAKNEKSSILMHLPLFVVIYGICIGCHIKRKGNVKDFIKMYFGIFLPYTLNFIIPIFTVTFLLVVTSWVNFFKTLNISNSEVTRYLSLLVFFLPVIVTPIAYIFTKK